MFACWITYAVARCFAISGWNNAVSVLYVLRRSLCSRAGVPTTSSRAPRVVLTLQTIAFSFIRTATTGFTDSISPCLNRVFYQAFERLELCELETLTHSS